MYVAVVGSDIACAATGGAVGAFGVVVGFSEDSIGQGLGGDDILPVVVGAVVGHDGLVLCGDDEGGGVGGVGVEAPHDELIGVSAAGGRGLEEELVALAEGEAGEGAGDLVDISVDVVAVGTEDGGVDSTHGGVDIDHRGNLHALEVAVAFSGDAGTHIIGVGVDPSVGGRGGGFPELVAAEVVHEVDIDGDILVKFALASGIDSHGVEDSSDFVDLGAHLDARGDEGVDE